MKCVCNRGNLKPIFFFYIYVYIHKLTYFLCHVHMLKYISRTRHLFLIFARVIVWFLPNFFRGSIFFSFFLFFLSFFLFHIFSVFLSAENAENCPFRKLTSIFLKKWFVSFIYDFTFRAKTCKWKSKNEEMKKPQLEIADLPGTSCNRLWILGNK